MFCSVILLRIQLQEVKSLVLAVKMACKSIANLVTCSPSPISQEYSNEVLESGGQSAQFNSMKKLDELSTNVLRNALRFTSKYTMVKLAKRFPYVYIRPDFK